MKKIVWVMVVMMIMMLQQVGALEEGDIIPHGDRHKSENKEPAPAPVPAPEPEVEPEAEIAPFATEESDEDLVGKIIPPSEAPFFREGESVWATYARTSTEDVNPDDLYRYYISKPNDKQVSPTSPQNLPSPAPQREASRQFFASLSETFKRSIFSIASPIISALSDAIPRVESVKGAPDTEPKGETFTTMPPGTKIKEPVDDPFEGIGYEPKPEDIAYFKGPDGRVYVAPVGAPSIRNEYFIIDIFGQRKEEGEKQTFTEDKLKEEGYIRMHPDKAKIVFEAQRKKARELAAHFKEQLKNIEAARMTGEKGAPIAGGVPAYTPTEPPKPVKIETGLGFRDNNDRLIEVTEVKKGRVYFTANGQAQASATEAEFKGLFNAEIKEYDDTIRSAWVEAEKARKAEFEAQRVAEAAKKVEGVPSPAGVEPKPAEPSIELNKDFVKNGNTYRVLEVYKVSEVEFVRFTKDGIQYNMRKDKFLNEEIKDAKPAEKGKEVAPVAKPEAPKAEAKPDFKKIIDTLFGDKKQFDTPGGTNYKIQEKEGKYVLTITRQIGINGPEELKDLTAGQLVEKLKEEGVRIAEPAEAITEPSAEAAKGTFETAGATTVLDRAGFEQKLRESGIPQAKINDLANTYMQRRDLTKPDNLNYELGTFKAGDKHRVVQIVLGAIVIAEDEDIGKARATAKARAEKHLSDNKDNNIKFNYLQYGRDIIEQVYGFKGGNLEHSKPTYHYKGKPYELKDPAKNLFRHESEDGYRELRIMEGHGAYELDVKTKDSKEVGKEITFYQFKNGRKVEVDSFEDDPEKPNDAFDKASNADPAKALQRRDFLIKALPLLQEAGVDFEDEKTIIEGGAVPKIYNTGKGFLLREYSRKDKDSTGAEHPIKIMEVLKGELTSGGGGLNTEKDHTITSIRDDNKLDRYYEQKSGKKNEFIYHHNPKTGELTHFTSLSHELDTLRLPPLPGLKPTPGELPKDRIPTTREIFGDTIGQNVFGTRFNIIKTSQGQNLIEVIPPGKDSSGKPTPGVYSNYDQGMPAPFGNPEFLDKNGKKIELSVTDLEDAKHYFALAKVSAEKYVNQLGTTLLKMAVTAGRGALGIAYITYQALPGVLSYYNQFKGLAAYGSLFGVEEWVPGWKEEVNNVFCNTVLLSELSKCPQSAICSRYSDVGGRSGSIVITSPPFAGTPQAGIHLEAEKSKPVTFFNATSKNNEQLVLYKVTYSLTNTGEKNMNYNLEFKGETTAKWFPEDKTLSSGQSDGRRPADPLLKYSKTDYGQICLGFNPRLRTFSGKRIGHFCADITEYKGDATRPYTQQTAETPTQPTETGAAPTAPPQPPGEGESV